MLEEEESKISAAENRATRLDEELQKAIAQSSDAKNGHDQERQHDADRIAQLDVKVLQLEKDLKESAE